MTITTLDSDIARTLEPRAAAPHRRLRTLRKDIARVETRMSALRIKAAKPAAK